MNPITVLPSFPVSPKHTDTEERDVGTCIYNAWQQARHICSQIMARLICTTHNKSAIVISERWLRRHAGKIWIMPCNSWIMSYKYPETCSNSQWLLEDPWGLEKLLGFRQWWRPENVKTAKFHQGATVLCCSESPTHLLILVTCCFYPCLINYWQFRL